MLDMRTLMITFVINSLMNTIVMAIYWRQNRKYYRGISTWLIALALQTTGFLLLGIRGMLPDILTIVFSNFLIASSSLMLFKGLKNFINYKSKDLHNYFIIFIYVLLQYYFTFVHESTSIRIFLISLVTSIMFIQSGKLMLSKSLHKLTQFTKITGIICYVYVLVQLYRSIVEYFIPTVDYMNAGFLATFGQVINQFLTIALVFSFIIMVNNLNLDKRIKFQNDLEEKERKLRNFIDFTSDWEFLILNDGSIDYISPSVERITGYKAQDFLENSALVLDIIHPDDRQNYDNHIHGEQCNLQFRIIDINGGTRWIEHDCKMIYDSKGDSEGRRVSNREITDRKKHEEEMIAAQAKIEDLYNSAPCGYHTIDKNGFIVNINNTELEWLGYKREEVVGKFKLSDITSSQSTAIVEEMFTGLIREGFQNDIRLEFVTKRGDIIPVIINSKAFYDNNNEYLFSLTTVFDRTEINRIEKALIEAQEKANSANQAKSEFLSKMSHELRTPLNAIFTLSGVLSRSLGTKIPEEEHSYLEIIQRSGNNLLELINDLLDISRIEAGRAELLIKNVNLYEVIENMIEMMKPLCAKKNIELNFSPNEEELFVVSDENKLVHIFQNLIGNAIKFTEEGYVTISIAKTNNSVIVSVQDTGIGIDETNLALIFDEFRQADQNITKKYGGTGLGLAIVKKYLELLEGSIIVNSKPGVGSEFIVEIPMNIKNIF
jgi:PAS domain S-box-containing protein